MDSLVRIVTYLKLKKKNLVPHLDIPVILMNDM